MAELDPNADHVSGRSAINETPSPETGPTHLTPFESAVVAIVNGTGPGDVLSYGDVAAEAGYPGAARAVGGVLARVDGLFWWRIVTANGRLVPNLEEEHARRLVAEGVVCKAGYVIAGGATD